MHGIMNTTRVMVEPPIRAIMAPNCGTDKATNRRRPTMPVLSMTRRKQKPERKQDNFVGETDLLAAQRPVKTGTIITNLTFYIK